MQRRSYPLTCANRSGWLAGVQTAGLFCVSIISAMTAARCEAVGGAYIPNRDNAPQLIAAFVLSHERKGKRVKTSGSNMRQPVELGKRPALSIAGHAHRVGHP